MVIGKLHFWCSICDLITYFSEKKVLPSTVLLASIIYFGIAANFFFEFWKVVFCLAKRFPSDQNVWPFAEMYYIYNILQVIIKRSLTGLTCRDASASKLKTDRADTRETQADRSDTVSLTGITGLTWLIGLTGLTWITRLTWTGTILLKSFLKTFTTETITHWLSYRT